MKAGPKMERNTPKNVGLWFEICFFSSLFGEMIQCDQSFANGLKLQTRIDIDGFGFRDTFRSKATPN